MELSLHNLKGANKKKKRIGRGNASGHGTYSTRGIKGQRSRSGGKGGLKRLGLRQVLFATPKKKGFKSAKPKNQVVNLSNLNKSFKDGGEINPKTLLKAKLINDIKSPIKILGNGELKLKKLKFSNVKMSESAINKIRLVA
ncbi:50S ribosomal protein L15 [Candidatus Parcubacteria bacterium]|nr:50S ribosomal protein L15 [Candidatus Parcubacteria bacterium]